MMKEGKGHVCYFWGVFRAVSGGEAWHYHVRISDSFNFVHVVTVYHTVKTSVEIVQKVNNLR